MNGNDRIIKMLIQLREAHNLTPEEFALKIGMKKQNYLRLESGKHEIKLTKLTEILDVFGLELIFYPKK